MYLSKRGILLFVAVLLIISGSVLAKTITVAKTYPPKQKVEINTVSSDVVVIQGNSTEIFVDVTYDIRPRGSYKPKFKERSNRIVLSEDFHSNSSISGRSLWTITVPKGTEIDFNSASGSFSCENFSGEIEGETASGDYEFFDIDGILNVSSASGDIDLTDCKGSYNISTASGNIKVYDCEGEFQASSASGNLKVKNVLLTEESDFSSASGNVYVELRQSPKYDMSLTSASGNSILNFNGNPVSGSFEFSANSRKGRIDSPFEFDSEERVNYRGNRDKYDVKIFQKGSASPNIFIHTSSGKAVLEEN